MKRQAESKLHCQEGTVDGGQFPSGRRTTGCSIVCCTIHLRAAGTPGRCLAGTSCSVLSTSNLLQHIFFDSSTAEQATQSWMLMLQLSKWATQPHCMLYAICQLP